MGWMWNAMWARIGWALGDLAVGAVVLAVVFIPFVVVGIKQARRQSRCSHDRFYETGACDAICSNCGRNLGFIGAWRDKQKQVAAASST